MNQRVTTGCAARVAARIGSGAAFLLALGAGSALAQKLPLLDAFESANGWRNTPTDGVALRVAPDSGVRGRALRLDFEFPLRGGQAAIRKAFNVTLPQNYELSLRVRGEGTPGVIQLSLVDQSGENVWRSQQTAGDVPRTWAELVRKKRHFRRSPGTKTAELSRVAAIEVAISSATNGKGTIWLDELQLRPREPDRPYALTPRVTATSEAVGSEARLTLDGDISTAWRSTTAASAPATPPPRKAPPVPAMPPNAVQAVVIDFVQRREFGGLRIDWENGQHASDYRIELSADGVTWDSRARVIAGNGDRDYVFLPESDARFVRLAIERGPSETFGIKEITIEPLEWSASKNAFFSAIAADAARGNYPKYLGGTQSYWTIAGADGDRAEVLVNEEGMVEPKNGGFSIEPFVAIGDSLFTWHDVQRTQSLAGGRFPEPSVRWTRNDWSMTLDPVAVLGGRDSSIAYLQYRIVNNARRRRLVRLYLAIRPFQVAPPWHRPAAGGVATITQLDMDNGTVRVNGEPVVVSLTPPTSFGAVSFDQGNIVDYLRIGRLPSAPNVRDPFGSASGALAYTTEVDSGASAVVEVALPLHPASLAQAERERVLGARAARDRVADARRIWRDAVERTTVELPPSASHIVSSLYASLAHMLVNRDHHALYAGSRAQERSWLRTGALQAATMLRVGRADVAKSYIEWYASLQYPNGRVPCCADARGADPTPQYDSQGEFIHLVAEYWRHTQDREIADRLWPNVYRAASYIDSLRQQRRTPEFQSGDKRVYFGILPPSIDLDGSTGRSLHSYFDDFFALRGLSDAVELARTLSRPEETSLVATRDEFRRDLYASMQFAMAHFRVDFLPGTADLANYDPISTMVAVAPAGETGRMPESVARAFDRTLDRYWADFTARRNGSKPVESYSSSELRAVGTMLRLDRREHAHTLLDAFFRDQRPAAWLQWPDIVWSDERAPRYTGDMPHSGAGAEYVRSVLDMFAYERDSDSALVIGAGVLEAWALERPGVTIRKLSTHYGPLSYTMRNENGNVRVSMQAGLRVPPGGIIVRSPFARPPREMRVNGVPTPPHPTDGVVVRAVPAEVVFRP